MAEAALEGVTKRFGATTAVEGVDLRLADGEFVVLLGPTGAGKTTTLRLFAGLETPEQGRVSIAGRDVTRMPPAERDVAFVFQQYSLYPHYTVFENMAFPLRAPFRRMSEEAVKARVGRVAEMLRISGKLGNRATQLSGGEMQRVSIGRALVREPNLFLMDEPLSSLDAKLRQDLRVELKRIQRDLGATILYVTHDQLEAMTLADRIGVLSEGRLVQTAIPRDMYERPDTIYAAQRLGTPQINLLQPGALGAPAGPAGARTMAVRPEDVEIAGEGEGVEARALTVEPLGVETVALLEIGSGRAAFTAHALLGARTTLRQGASVRLRVRPGAPLYFDAEGRRMTQGGSAPATTTAASGTTASSGGETALLIACAHAVRAAIAANEAEIEGLDRAIGDGDHYINMRRGTEVLTQMAAELAPLPPDEALKAVAKKLLMTIGGASGPLIASFFLEMGKAEGAAGPWTATTVARMVSAGVEAIKKRGKADLGDKTMLDVLIPVARALEAAAARGAPAREILAELPKVAEAGMLATRDLRATKGRAAFLGERAIGHIDPGSKSSAVVIAAVCATTASRAG